MLEPLLNDSGTRVEVVIESVAPYPLALSHVAISTDGENIWGVGGHNNSAINVNNVYEYSIENNTWTPKANFPSIIRAGACYADKDQVIYAGGGGPGSGNQSGMVYVYNRRTNTWTRKTTVNIPPAGEVAFAQIEDRALYVFGGFNGNLVINRTDKINIDGAGPQSVTNLAGTPDIRATNARWDGGDYIYIVGGIGLGNFKRYKISTNTWESLPSIPAIGHSTHLLIVEGAVFALSCNNNNVYRNQVFKFDLYKNTWKEEVFKQQAPIHGLATSVQIGEELFIVAGYNGSSRIANVSRLKLRRF